MQSMSKLQKVLIYPPCGTHLLHTFSPSSCCTLRLIRLNMKGLRIMWSLLSWCSLSVPLFSAWLSISFENHSLNSSWESKRVGMIKWRRAQSSNGWIENLGLEERHYHKKSKLARPLPCMLFWIGVPVSNKRFLQWKPSRIFHLALAELLIAWASSRTYILESIEYII
jgi:hypothetical protein